jgi:hypothetical protein
MHRTGMRAALLASAALFAIGFMETAIAQQPTAGLRIELNQQPEPCFPLPG